MDGGRLLGPHGAVVAEGTLYTTEILDEQLEYAREGLSDQIEAFAENTMTYLREEKELLLEGVGVPEVRTQIEGRHVLIVVRGYDYRSDLDALRPYISEYRPLLMGVDGGADALIEAGYKPDMIIGDMDSCSDATLALRGRAGRARLPRRPGPRYRADLTQLGLDAVVFPALGTSEDAAMLLADSKGARLLVAVGTHASLVEFLDKGRAGMASTFLTRLRVGPEARRRQGRLADLPQPDQDLAPGAAGAVRAAGAGHRAAVHRRRLGDGQRDRGPAPRPAVLGQGLFT